MQKLTKQLDTLIKYGIAAILIAVPLYPKFPFLNVPGIYVSIRIEDFLILVVAILWFISNFSNMKNLWKNEIIRAIAIFLVAGLIATASGVLFLHTATGLVGFLEWARRGEYLIAFFIGLTSIKSIKDLEFYMKCIGVVLVIVFVFGIAQKYFGAPVITTQNSEYSKGIALRFVPGTQLVSTFAGHYDLASYILLTSPILVGVFFVVKKNWQKIGIFMVVAISFWLMVNAASRITSVAYVMSVCGALFLIRKYKYIPVVLVISAIFIFATSSLFDRYLNILNLFKKMSMIPQAYAQNVSTLPASTPVPPPAPAFEDRSTSIRLNVEWPRAIRAFEKNPLLGTGYASTTLATDNDYLRSLGEIGLLGTIAFFMLFFRVYKKLLAAFFGNPPSLKLWRAKEINFRTVYLAGVIAMIPGVLLNGVFIDVFEASKFAIPFWFIIGFAIALIARPEKNNA